MFTVDAFDKNTQINTKCCKLKKNIRDVRISYTVVHSSILMRQFPIVKSTQQLYILI